MEGGANLAAAPLTSIEPTNRQMLSSNGTRCTLETLPGSARNERNQARSRVPFLQTGQGLIGCLLILLGGLNISICEAYISYVHQRSHTKGRELRRHNKLQVFAMYSHGSKDSNFPPVNLVDQQEEMTTRIPNHVAFICDGNSRWAKARGVPTALGHAAGADRLVQILTALKSDGISYCTMYGFSTENWKRPQEEIDDILSVMELTARRFYNRALEERVQVKILGDMHDERLPHGLREILEKLERDTLKFAPTTVPTSTLSINRNTDQSTSLMVCLAVNYGGRQDIVNASLRLAQAIANGDVDPANVSEDTFASLLCTEGIPDPDLIIRTSGESRLSNFLLWNAAYSELYFSPVLWPDFGEEHWKTALAWYGDRKRRFGTRGERKKRQIYSVHRNGRREEEPTLHEQTVNGTPS